MRWFKPTGSALQSFSSTRRALRLCVHWEGNMKKYRQLFAAGIAFLALAWVSSGNGAKVTALITGTNAFVSSKDLKPGSFRKITVADLPEPMPPAGRGGFRQAHASAGRRNACSARWLQG